MFRFFVLDCSVIFDDGPVSVVENSAVDELSTLKAKSSIVVYISDNDVSVVFVGESEIFADVSVPVISISVVFVDGPAPAVDNLVVDCSIAAVFDSVEESSAVVYESDDDGSVTVVSISVVFANGSDSRVDNSFVDDSVVFCS